MHRRAYSASRKAPVMQAKANRLKRKPAAALTSLPQTARTGLRPKAALAPTCRRESGSRLLVRKVGAANGYTFAPERYSPATFAGDTACSHHCCRSAGLADSRTSRQTSRYQAQRVSEPNQEWRVLSNG